MERPDIPRTGLRVSRLGLGTVQFGLDYGFTKAKTQSEVDAILDAAWERGIGTLDTARAYGTSEAKIGDYLRRRPDARLTVMTKLDKLPTGGDAGLRRLMERSLEESRRALGRDSIPVLQLHQAEESLTGSETFWEVIADFKARKLIGAFGVSVYTPEETRALVQRSGPHIDLVQVPFSVFDQRFAALLPELQRARIAVVSRSALLRGVIGRPPAGLPHSLAGLKAPLERLQEEAARRKLSSAELALDFALAFPGVASTIIGVDSAAELERNARSLDRLEAARGLAGELRGLAVADAALIDPRGWGRA